MKLIAEYVSPGHPDRLCDTICKSIVDWTLLFESNALVGIECAVNRNKVFLDGRIAGRLEKIIERDIAAMVRRTYGEAGYNENFLPAPHDLEIINEIKLEELSEEEKGIRKFSDDQNIVCGFAVNNIHTKYMPIEQYLVLYIGDRMCRVRKFDNTGFVGPDFKIMIDIEEEYDSNKNIFRYKWNKLTLSVEHSIGAAYIDMYKYIKRNVDIILEDFVNDMKDDENDYSELKTISDEKFLYNGAGDFIDGGPYGDNGLSGKKLVIDFYGPRVPIGGGAIYGKDYHKVDFCGAFRARQFALKLLKENNSYMAYTKLAWSPGDEMPYLIDAYQVDRFGTRLNFDEKSFPARDWFSIECINRDNDFRHKQRIIDYY